MRQIVPFLIAGVLGGGLPARAQTEPVPVFNELETSTVPLTVIVPVAAITSGRAPRARTVALICTSVAYNTQLEPLSAS